MVCYIMSLFKKKSEEEYAKEAIELNKCRKKFA